MTKIETFRPNQYEIKKNRGLAVSWAEISKSGEAKIFDKRVYESADLPHPDFEELVKEFGTILLTMLDISLKTSEQEDSPQEKIIVKRVDVSGEDQPESAKITAYIQHVTGQKTNISTPFIKLSEDNYGIETDLRETVNKISYEAYSYVFENKRAQLSMFGNTSETADSEDQEDDQD